MVPCANLAKVNTYEKVTKAAKHNKYDDETRAIFMVMKKSVRFGTFQPKYIAKNPYLKVLSYQLEGMFHQISVHNHPLDAMKKKRNTTHT